jgi:hypothetical protein
MKFTIPVTLCFLSLASVSAFAQDGWTTLFDGKSIEGWTVKSGKATYEVVDGTILGTTVEGSPNSFLCSSKEYGDFELEFEVKVHAALNSGVQIRSKLKDIEKDKFGGRLFGPQVEIEASGAKGAEAGYIYGEAMGGGWRTPADRLKPHKHLKDDEWNKFRILAEGPRIQTWINGVAIEDLTDEEMYKSHPKGLIGLQVHGIGKKAGPFDVAWKDIRIREIGVKGTKVLFDGKNTDAFLPNKWVIEDGLLARKKGSGYIWTKDSYGDFVLNLEVKMSKKCNSGVFFRTDPKNPVQGGFEIQVMDTYGKDKPGKNDGGALYDAVAPTKNAIKSAGEWNTMQITAKGPNVTVVLNGEKVIEANLDEWTTSNQNPDGGKNKFKTALKDLPRTGHIGFQDHGHDVWFRNVTITE